MMIDPGYVDLSAAMLWSLPGGMWGLFAGAIFNQSPKPASGAFFGGIAGGLVIGQIGVGTSYGACLGALLGYLLGPFDQRFEGVATNIAVAGPLFSALAVCYTSAQGGWL